MFTQIFRRKTASHHSEPPCCENNCVSNSGLISHCLSELDKLKLSCSNTVSPCVLDKLSHDKNDEVLCLVAENPLTPVKAMETLSTHRSYEVRTHAAHNVCNTTRMLTVLADDKDIMVRCAVAQNPAIPESVQDKLSYDSSELVRYCLAKNRKLTEGNAYRLSLEKLWRIRAELAYSSHIAPPLLATLAEDRSVAVRLSAAQNTLMCSDVLLKMEKNEKQGEVLEKIRKNPSLPVSRIVEIAQSHDHTFRYHVVLNPSLPYEDLLLMLNDSSQAVRERAEAVLRKRNGSARLQLKRGDN